MDVRDENHAAGLALDGLQPEFLVVADGGDGPLEAEGEAVETQGFRRRQEHRGGDHPQLGHKAFELQLGATGDEIAVGIPGSDIAGTGDKFTQVHVVTCRFGWRCDQQGQESNRHQSTSDVHTVVLGWNVTNRFICRNLAPARRMCQGFSSI